MIQQLISNKNTAYYILSGTNLRLQEVSSGLEDLRERVAAPALAATTEDMSLQVQIDTIDKGVQRLEAGRLRASSAKRQHLDDLQRQLNRNYS